MRHSRFRLATLPLASALLLLSACEEPATPVDAEPETASAATPVSSEPGPAAPGDPVGAGQAIPARFLGVWDYAEGRCLPASDLRMEISPRRIVFYESVGDVTAVAPDGPDAVLVSLSMSGEGETWTNRMRLDLGEDGTTLVPGDADADRPGQPLPRTRCE